MRRKSELTRLVNLIYAEGEISRVDLARKANLVPSYVSSMVLQLRQRELILEGARVPSDRGRRKVLLHINPDLAHVMGVEIGRVHTRIVISDLLGRVLSYQKLPLDVSGEVQSVLDHVYPVIEEGLKQHPNVQGIGIAHSGFIDRATGTVLFWPKAPGWRDVPLKRLFAEKYGLTTVLEDSARTTAIAEQRFGHGRGQLDFVFVHAGVGIGAAIFLDGRLYSGRDGMAGELGHTTIDETGPLCSCGNRGCLEVYASGAAIIDKVRAGLSQGVACSLAAKDVHRISLEAIAAAAESHDRLCETVLEEAGVRLGTALASMVNLLNPGRIVLGGTLPRVTKNLLMEPLQRSLRSRAFQRSANRVEILVSNLGEDAAARGACLLTAEEIVKKFCAPENNHLEKVPATIR
jgi:predicted NBD/HSP70 family sugar kinase